MHGLMNINRHRRRNRKSRTATAHKQTKSQLCFCFCLCRALIYSFGVLSAKETKPKSGFSSPFKRLRKSSLGRIGELCRKNEKSLSKQDEKVKRCDLWLWHVSRSFWLVNEIPGVWQFFCVTDSKKKFFKTTSQWSHAFILIRTSNTRRNMNKRKNTNSTILHLPKSKNHQLFREKKKKFVSSTYICVILLLLFLIISFESCSMHSQWVFACVYYSLQLHQRVFLLLLPFSNTQRSPHIVSLVHYSLFYFVHAETLKAKNAAHIQEKTQRELCCISSLPDFSSRL